ncbi:UbiE family methyltransferase [Hysterangium stoloniferum]|nr:UbiE family methyltransferase [Hysterangium stoloniferum]
MSQTTTQYIHGHHESVLRSHTWRTAKNSAAYMLDYINPSMYILDVGCGPGTITADFAAAAAALVPQGKVLGLEHAPDILQQARSTASKRALENTEFAVGNVHALEYHDGTFDIVHAHQALREMRHYSSIIWFPEVEGLQQWKNHYVHVARSVGGEPDAGRQMHAWARKAGFSKSNVKAMASTWCYNTPEEKTWWSEMWADRITALTGGHADEEELTNISKAWREWGAREDGWFTMICGELVCCV